MADCTVTMTQTEIEHALYAFARRQNRLEEVIAACGPLHATLRRDMEEDAEILRGLREKFRAAAAKPRYTSPNTEIWRDLAQRFDTPGFMAGMPIELD